MDFSDYNSTLAALLETARHTLRTELTSVWLPIQLGLIGLAAVMAVGIAAAIKNRADLVTLTLNWPPILRMIVRGIVVHLAAIAFVLVLLMIRAGLRADVVHPRTY